MAPELTVESKKGYIGYPVDMWSFGALLFEMLHNRVAFNGISVEQLHQRIRQGRHTAFRKEISKPLKQLILGMLDVEPSSRLTADKAARLPCFAKAGSLDSQRAASYSNLEV